MKYNTQNNEIQHQKKTRKKTQQNNKKQCIYNGGMPPHQKAQIWKVFLLIEPASFQFLCKSLSFDHKWKNTKGDKSDQFCRDAETFGFVVKMYYMLSRLHTQNLKVYPI